MQVIRTSKQLSHIEYILERVNKQTSKQANKQTNKHINEHKMTVIFLNVQEKNRLKM